MADDPSDPLRDVLERREAELAAAKREILRKDQIIAALQHRLFGSKSERYHPDQEQLEFGEDVLGKFKGQTNSKFPLAKIRFLPHPTVMRTSRLLGEGRSFYHVMSRVVDRRMVFQAKDKEVFRKILRNQEAFTGVRVVTY